MYLNSLQSTKKNLLNEMLCIAKYVEKFLMCTSELEWLIKMMHQYSKYSVDQTNIGHFKTSWKKAKCNHLKHNIHSYSMYMCIATCVFLLFCQCRVLKQVT